MTHRPVLGADPRENRRTLQDVLDGPPGVLDLPPGTHPVADGLRVPGGWTVRGAGAEATRLASTGTGGHPVLHVLGSGVRVRDLGLDPPPADPGEHGGDRGTALTVGGYLYAAVPEWVSDVDVRRVRVRRAAGDRHANSVAVMGAVRDVTLHDVDVHGGHTGLAVHWGAVGADVASIAGPTYHPHRLTVTELRVRDAVEGFYLSSVHDVTVRGSCLRDVEMGFRLLPGDNADRFVAAPISHRVEVADACVHWTGPRYGVRIAGWGRSEIDGVVSELGWTDTVVRDCVLRGSGGAGTWSPVLVERAAGVRLANVRVETDAEADCCPLGARDRAPR